MIGTTVFVDHNGNLQSYDFPECFITDTLRFVDKEYQTSMMQEISRNELVQEKTSSYISKRVLRLKIHLIQMYVEYQDLYIRFN